MDFSNLKDSVSNLSLYDLKAGVRKVQNAVMNYTEMEAKVREATNNEPWGASSTLMQEIANGTYSYQLLNEIMPMIYKRFTEKAAEEWRQIYKGLQLLEFLIKNGSERVIDDARSHLSLLKMLRQFQFLDQNGKDQGINVRNRAKELAELLSDVDRIRAERKKARSNRNKFGGVEGGGGLGGTGMSVGGMSSSSRYGGFGSEDAGYGGYTGRTYGDGGGFGGDTSSGFQDSGRRDKFEEYDEGDDPTSPPPSSRRTKDTSTGQSVKRKTEPQKPKEPEVDLFDFGEDEAASVLSPVSNGKQPATSAGDDDDFDDFISATPPASMGTASSMSSIPQPQSTTTISSNTHFAAPKPVSAVQGANMSGLVSLSSMSSAPAQPMMTSTPNSAFSSPPPLTQQAPITAVTAPQPSRPTGYQVAQPNYFTTITAAPVPTAATNQGSGNRPGISSTSSFGGNKPASKPSSSGNDAFGSLWSTASAGAGIKKTTSTTGPNLASLAKEKASAGIWGTSTAAKPAQQQQQVPPAARQQQGGGQKIGGGLDDLLG